MAMAMAMAPLHDTLGYRFGHFDTGPGGGGGVVRDVRGSSAGGGDLAKVSRETGGLGVGGVRRRQGRGSGSGSGLGFEVGLVIYSRILGSKCSRASRGDLSSDWPGARNKKMHNKKLEQWASEPDSQVSIGIQDVLGNLLRRRPGKLVTLGAGVIP